MKYVTKATMPDGSTIQWEMVAFEGVDDKIMRDVSSTVRTGFSRLGYANIKTVRVYHYEDIVEDDDET